MNDLVGFATWYELRCPTEPGTVVWNGKVLHVRQLHIDAAKDEPHATFEVTRSRGAAGEFIYRLEDIRKE